MNEAATMQRPGPVAWGASWLLLANLGGRPLSFVLTLYVARLLGPSDFGILSYLLAYGFLFSVGMDLGLDLLLVREVARDQSRAMHWLGHASLIKGLAGVAMIGLMVVLARLLAVPEYTSGLVILVGLVYLTLTQTNALRYTLRGLGHLDYEALSMLMERLALVLFAGAALLLFRTVPAILGGYLAAYGIAYGASRHLLRRRVSPSVWHWDRRFGRSLLRAGLAFFLMNLFIAIYGRIDTVLLALFKDASQVGWYTSAYRIIEMIMLVPSLIVAPVYPLLSQQTQQRSRQAALCSQIPRILLLLSLPLASLGSLFGPSLLRWLYGSAYTPAGWALAILVWAFPPIALNFFLGSLLAALDRQAVVTRNAGLCALLNLGLNLWAIPRWGIIGASITTVATEGLLVLLNGWPVRDRFRRQGFPAFAMRLILCCALAVLCATVLSRWALALGWMVVLSCLGLLGLLFGLRLIDWATLRSWLTLGN